MMKVRNVMENVNERKNRKKYIKFRAFLRKYLSSHTYQVYANAKISNKGYDTSQFVSSFRKALVPIGNQPSFTFGSGNSEHVSRRMNEDKYENIRIDFRKNLFDLSLLNRLKFQFRIIKDRSPVVVWVFDVWVADKVYTIQKKKML